MSLGGTTNVELIYGRCFILFIIETVNLMSYQNWHFLLIILANITHIKSPWHIFYPVAEDNLTLFSMKITFIICWSSIRSEGNQAQDIDMVKSFFHYHNRECSYHIFWILHSGTYTTPHGKKYVSAFLGLQKMETEKQINNGED